MRFMMKEVTMNLENLKNMVTELNEDDCYDIEGSGAGIAIAVIGGTAMVIGTIAFFCVVCNKVFSELDLVYTGQDPEEKNPYCPDCGTELVVEVYDEINPGC